MEMQNWLASLAQNSVQLMLVGGLLLVLAGIMLAVGRKRSVTLSRSLLTDEVIIYLGRIANALEQPHVTPSTDQVAAEVLRRLEEIAAAKGNVASAKVQPMPLSMFGREILQDK
jgi:hypothetical protein